jgi:pimeloyl-ACP methyl ester carboxylesterase
VQRLILHSCAPSSLPYPDNRAEAVFGPVVFSALLQGLVWWTIRRVVRREAGLRMMMSQLSNVPVSRWWGTMSPADKDEARRLFRSMRSDSGFANDLRQGHPADADMRREAMWRVNCPTLVTASRHDGGVSFAHAEDFAHVIHDAELVELTSPSHLFWIGTERARLLSILDSFVGG